MEVTFKFSTEYIDRNREASQRSEPSNDQNTITTRQVTTETTLTTVTTETTSTNPTMSEQNESAAWPKADAALTQVRKALRSDSLMNALADMLLGAS